LGGEVSPRQWQARFESSLNTAQPCVDPRAQRSHGGSLDVTVSTAKMNSKSGRIAYPSQNPSAAEIAPLKLPFRNWPF
jgi:hypothetical protein